MKPNIFILSKPIQSGKTTSLMEWCEGKNNVTGILTPDKEGFRKLYDIKNKTYLDFEVKYPLTDLNMVSIGKYNFFEHVFEKAQQIILNQTSSDFFIIDEIGRLELNQNKGLEPALGVVINKFINKEVSGNLILVIRDYLLDECIEKYQLQEAKIIDSIAEIPTTNNLFGLVLCGGSSVRMKTDKAFLSYFDKEQIYYLADKMESICEQVFISCNESQKDKIDPNYKVIVDSATFQNSGPINAILTAFELYPNKPIFVLACDYPLLTSADLVMLKDVFLKHKKTVSFYNNNTNFREPLIAIYHPSDLRQLLAFYKNGNTSLQMFLNDIDALKVEPLNLKSIISIDSPSDFYNIKSNLI
jgi:molybdopterin-guanine dinucleotide biosynthesis protein A